MSRRWEVVAEIVRDREYTKGAEIGIWKGQTFFYLLDKFPKLFMIGVDSWTASTEKHEKNVDDGISSWKSPEEMAQYEKAVKDKADLYPRATLYHMTSLEAALKVQRESLDFVFIDADHREKSVLDDVHAWRSKVRMGGYIIGHDRQWPSVERALIYLFGSWEEHDDNVWAVYR